MSRTGWLELGALSVLVFAGCGGGGASGKTNGDDDGGSGSCECKVDWNVENFAICVAKATSFSPTIMYSSHLGPDGKPACDVAKGFPQPVPKAAWSAQQINSSCTGQGKVCVRVRQGQADAASDQDCILNEQCVSFDYEKANESVEIPQLAAWSAQDQTCAHAYEQGGGYLELWVESASVSCGGGEQKIKRIPTCPVGCDLPEKAGAPECEICGDSSQVTTF